MAFDKIFTCQRCDNNIEVEDVRNTDSTVCHNCGQMYRLHYVEEEDAWEMIPVESVEERRRQLSEQKEEEPFQILREPSALREDDTDKL